MMRLEGRAPAKLNLTLEVLGRRADGYHEVASVMHTLSLCDTLTLELPPPDRLNPARGAIHIVEASDGAPLRETIPTDSRNLVWQAVARFVALTPSPSPAAWERGDARQHFWSAEASASAACGSSASALHIPLSRVGGEGDTGGEGNPSWHATLLKRIPSQAGLGGGSSDAACALRLLNQWAARYERALSDDALHTLASELGADVAFFLHGGCALATGKGIKRVVGEGALVPRRPLVKQAQGACGVAAAPTQSCLRRDALGEDGAPRCLNPLRKVPPARRGNRGWVVPLAKRRIHPMRAG